MDDSVRRLIFEAIDGTISPEDFERLQSAIEQSDEVRDEYLRMLDLCEDLAEIAVEGATEAVPFASPGPRFILQPRRPPKRPVVVEPGTTGTRRGSAGLGGGRVLVRPPQFPCSTIAGSRDVRW